MRMQNDGRKHSRPPTAATTTDSLSQTALRPGQPVPHQPHPPVLLLQTRWCRTAMPRNDRRQLPRGVPNRPSFKGGAFSKPARRDDGRTRWSGAAAFPAANPLQKPPNLHRRRSPQKRAFSPPCFTACVARKPATACRPCARAAAWPTPRSSSCCSTGRPSGSQQ